MARSREMRPPDETLLPIFAADDDPQLSIRKVFAEAVANLQAREAAVSFHSIIAVAERIGRADRLYFLGLGGSGGVGELAEVMFSGLGFNAKALSDPYSMLLAAGHVRRNHLVFARSNSMAVQLTLIRALYILVASRISPEVLHEVNRIEQAVNQSLRLKTKKGPKIPTKEGHE